MDWKITSVNDSEEGVIVIAETRLDYAQLANLLGMPGGFEPSVPKKKQEKKKPRKYKKRANEPFDKKAYNKAFNARKKAAGDHSPPTVRMGKDEGSYKKALRLQRLQDKIDKVEEEMPDEIPERP